MKKIIVGLALSLLASQSFGNTVTGTIKRLHIYNNDLAYIDMGLEIQKPECATNTFWDYIFDPKTTVGALKYSTLLSALNSNKRIQIKGLDTCEARVMEMDWVIILSD